MAEWIRFAVWGGLHVSSVRSRKTNERSRNVQQPVEVPSPEEIELRAAQIRAGWSPRDHQKRGSGRASLEVCEISLAAHRRGFSYEF